MTRMLSLTFTLLLVFVATATNAADPLAHFDPKGQPPSKFTLELRNGLKAHAAVRGQARLRRGEEGLHRRAAVQADHGRRRPRRLGHGQLPVAAVGQGLREHPSVAAAPGRAEHGLRPLRGGAGPHLPGARLRPRQHQLHQGRHRLDRVRSADRAGNRPRRARAHQREARQAPGGRRRLLALARGPLRRRARRGGRGRRGERQGHGHRPRGLHGGRDRGERVRGQRDVAPHAVAVRDAAAAQPVRPRGPVDRQERRQRQQSA